MLNKIHMQASVSMQTIPVV